jgi:hypothetical protein
MKKIFPILTMILFAGKLGAQQKQDTVIVELAKTSRVIFTIRDRNDLEILKHYNFDQLFHDILKKLEANDTTALSKRDSTETDRPVAENGSTAEDWGTTDNHDDGHDDNSDDHWEHHSRRGRTWQSFNFDFGTNNYLANGKFPDSENATFSVRPWGSWYFAASSIQRTRLGKKFFLEWGVGVSWYTFKFQNDNIIMQKDDDGVHFVEDTNPERDYTKSKLSASYLMASLVPVIDFGDNNQRVRIWEGDESSFRIGLGPYIGYRVGSHSKVVYEEDGDREKDKERDNFYLNNFRYGARLQLGYRTTDVFFNYDLNELFSEGKGPKLNAFSFGIIF